MSFKEVKPTNTIDIKKGDVKQVTGIYRGYDKFTTKMGEATG